MSNSLNKTFQKTILKKVILLAILLFSILSAGILTVHTRMTNIQTERFGEQLKAIVKPLMLEGNQFEAQRQLLQFTKYTDLESAILIKQPGQVLFTINREGPKPQLEQYFRHSSPMKNLFSTHIYGGKSFKLFESSKNEYTLYYQLENHSQVYLIFFTLLSILVLVTTIIFTWGTLIRSFFTKLTNPLTKMEEALDQYIHEGTISNDHETSNIEEYQKLFNRLKTFKEELKNKEETIKKKSFDEAMGKVSIQLFHDLKSPLAVLEMTTKEIYDEEKQYLARSSIMRIREMSKDLLKSRKDRDQTKLISKEKKIIDKKCIVQLSDFISELKMKWELLTKDNGIEIKFISHTDQDISMKLSKDGLIRSLNNLIQNAIDAFPEEIEGKVRVLFTIEDEFLKITVLDNGTGIPKEIQDRLFLEEVTHGKENGNGLGLMQVKQFLTDHEGSVDYNTSDHGTEIMITLPIYQTPKRIDLIQIDDDDLIRMAWKIEADKFNLNIAQFESFEEFDQVKDSFSKETSIFIDYKLKGIDGIEGANILRADGFSKVTISTGLPADEFSAANSYFISDKSFPLRL